jgi:hypothetical protein
MSDDNRILCEELGQQLNLSNTSQVKDILRLISLNAPHILKRDSSYVNRLTVDEGSSRRTHM